MGARQFNRSKTFWRNDVNWEDKTDEILVVPKKVIIQNYFSQMIFDSVILYNSYQECTHRVFHTAP